MKHPAHLMQVPADHPMFPGHFPGNPVIPGAALLAMVAECATGLGFPGTRRSWRRIKFLRPVGPDEPFRIRIEGDHHRFTFRIESADGRLVAHGQCSHDPLA